MVKKITKCLHNPEIEIEIGIEILNDTSVGNFSGYLLPNIIYFT